ncbi:MAG: hypothetical protein IPI28_18950 [Candidatus Omnitrophica bacterium]|nr:hypothetical protein [Candidatus Omnitrophota bacterium]
MSQSIVINGVTYSQPDQGTYPPWGDVQAAIIVALAQTTLQRTGGSFTLTAETDFGATYGLKAVYFKGAGTAAGAGTLRLARGSSIRWRNEGNTDDLTLGVSAENELEYEGALVLVTPAPVANLEPLTNSRAVITTGGGLLSTGSTTATEIGYVNGVTSAIQTQINAKLTNPMTTNGDLVAQAAGVPARIPVGGNGLVLTVVSGAPAWAAVAGTGDVVGPSSAVDGDIAAFDGTTGKLLKVSTREFSSLVAMAEITPLYTGAGTFYLSLSNYITTNDAWRKVMPRAGSVVGCSVYYYPYGTATSSDVQTNLQKNGSNLISGPVQAVTVGTPVANYQTFARGTYPFSAGDQIGVQQVTTNYVSAPSTINMRTTYTIEVVFD